MATDLVLSIQDKKIKWAKIGWMYSYGKMTWAEIPQLNCETT